MYVIVNLVRWDIWKGWRKSVRHSTLKLLSEVYKWTVRYYQREDAL